MEDKFFYELLLISFFVSDKFLNFQLELERKERKPQNVINCYLLKLAGLKRERKRGREWKRNPMATVLTLFQKRSKPISSNAI